MGAHKRVLIRTSKLQANTLPGKSGLCEADLGLSRSIEASLGLIGTNSSAPHGCKSEGAGDGMGGGRNASLLQTPDLDML